MSMRYLKSIRINHTSQKVGGSPADKELIATLQKENEELKAKVQQTPANINFKIGMCCPSLSKKSCGFRFNILNKKGV